MLKSRDITLPTKVHLVKAMIFPAVMYGCESQTLKKAECRRIDAFKLWCWRRLLRVPWKARRSNQFILKKLVLNIHWKDWCWSWNSNTLATWGEELTHLKRPWCWERLRAGEGDDSGWDGWMASLTQWTWVWVDSKNWWWTTNQVGCKWLISLSRILQGSSVLWHMSGFPSFLRVHNVSLYGWTLKNSAEWNKPDTKRQILGHPCWSSG